MLESGIGSGICVELAALSNFVYPNDLFPAAAYYEEDLTEPQLVLNKDRTFSVSNVAGIPYKPVQERVDRAAKHHAVIEEQK